jgi:hypothetical protein
MDIKLSILLSSGQNVHFVAMLTKNLNEMLWGSFLGLYIKIGHFVVITRTNSCSHCIKNFVLNLLISNALNWNAMFFKINGLLKLICLNWHFFLWIFFDLIWNLTFYYNYKQNIVKKLPLWLKTLWLDFWFQDILWNVYYD